MAELELSTYGYTLARRAGGLPVFAHDDDSSKYYMQQTVVQAIAGRNNIQARTILPPVLVELVCCSSVQSTEYSSLLPGLTAIGNISVPVQLAQCWFPGLAIFGAKI